MKTWLGLLLSVSLISSQFAFAETRLERFERLKDELAQTKEALGKAQQDRNHHVWVTIEASVGTLIWGGVGVALIKSGGGDIGPIFDFMGRIVLAGAVVPVAIAGYQGYKLYLNHQQMDELQKLIAQKQESLEQARKVLEEMESKAQN